MEHPVRRNHLLFSFLALPPCLSPPSSPCSPLCSRTGWKCPQISPQLPAIPPGCRSSNYQRTSLTTAWGIRLNPLNVFILKKRCTFNRKPWVLFFFFFLSLLLAFFCKKEKKGLKKKKNHNKLSILENGKRCSRVCVRALARLCMLSTLRGLTACP